LSTLHPRRWHHASIFGDGPRAALVNVKMAEASAIALAKQAVEEGITQKQFICRALEAAGVPMDPLDLEDRTPRRRSEAA
jgi:hypothetical protein